MIENVVEMRHELIHRWLLKYSWPTEKDSDGLNKIIRHSEKLSKDANDLTRLLVKAIHDWFSKFPDSRHEFKSIPENWIKNLKIENI